MSHRYMSHVWHICLTQTWVMSDTCLTQTWVTSNRYKSQVLPACSASIKIFLATCQAHCSTHTHTHTLTHSLSHTHTHTHSTSTPRMERHARALAEAAHVQFLKSLLSMQVSVWNDYTSDFWVFSPAKNYPTCSFRGKILKERTCIIRRCIRREISRLPSAISGFTILLRLPRLWTLGLWALCTVFSWVMCVWERDIYVCMLV